jgi:hypothetical protein
LVYNVIKINPIHQTQVSGEKYTHDTQKAALLQVRFTSIDWLPNVPAQDVFISNITYNQA